MTWRFYIISKLNVIRDIVNLCETASATMEDSMTFKIGVVSWCCTTNFALKSNSIISWPRQSKEYLKVRGGELIFKRGRRVKMNICLDFKSLYPSIMRFMNISPENIIILREIHPSVAIQGELAVDWEYRADSNGVDKSCNISRSSGAENIISITFPGNRQGIIPLFCKYLIDQRQEAKDNRMEERASSLKIISNSVYGSLCFPFYPSYSPFCASAVTGCGRWA